MLVVCLLALVAVAPAPTAPEWGFFGHRRINRLATFTLPAGMGLYFRDHIDYLSEHAVDPDKRRYASDYEAVRHYMDLDHWGHPPFSTLPRTYADARAAYGHLLDIGPTGDTTVWYPDTLLADHDLLLLRSADHTVDVAYGEYRRLWYARMEEVAGDSLRNLGIPVTGELSLLEDPLSAHGILPYYLPQHHRRLTQAFVDRDAERILQLAAELGHYVGDAHVPLHTTENYNGQLSGQTGIHAFWESRLPELFADAEYDYFVGPADYIADPESYYWDIVLESHALVDSVLNTERRLRATYPVDQQRCYEERLGRTVATECSEFSRAWSAAMNGMVEARFRAAIRAVGSAWYSCWVDAGQPDLRELDPALAATLADTTRSTVGQHPLRPHE